MVTKNVFGQPAWSKQELCLEHQGSRRCNKSSPYQHSSHAGFGRVINVCSSWKLHSKTWRTLSFVSWDGTAQVNAQVVGKGNESSKNLLKNICKELCLGWLWNKSCAAVNSSNLRQGIVSYLEAFQRSVFGSLVVMPPKKYLRPSARRSCCGCLYLGRAGTSAHRSWHDGWCLWPAWHVLSLCGWQASRTKAWSLCRLVQPLLSSPPSNGTAAAAQGKVFAACWAGQQHQSPHKPMLCIWETAQVLVGCGMSTTLFTSVS